MLARVAYANVASVTSMPWKHLPDVESVCECQDVLHSLRQRYPEARPSRHKEQALAIGGQVDQDTLVRLIDVEMEQQGVGCERVRQRLFGCARRVESSQDVSSLCPDGCPKILVGGRKRVQTWSRMERSGWSERLVSGAREPFTNAAMPVSDKFWYVSSKL